MNRKTEWKKTHLLGNAGGRAVGILCLSFMLQNTYALALPSPTEYLNSADKLELMQNTHTVKGVVKDQSGEPLGGVSIVVKGTATGTSTDWDGNFTLEVPNGNAVLSFSFIGFKNQDIPVNNQKTLNVILAEEIGRAHV